MLANDGCLDLLRIGVPYCELLVDFARGLLASIGAAHQLVQLHLEQLLDQRATRCCKEPDDLIDLGNRQFREA
jgi:hypothetical protein